MRFFSIFFSLSFLAVIRSSPINPILDNALDSPVEVVTSIIASPLEVITGTKTSTQLPSVYTAAPFATNGPYSEFYSGFEPTQTSVEPQPKVSDPVNSKIYPLNLTGPDTIPPRNLVDPIVLPPSREHPNINATVYQPGINLSTAESLAALETAFDQISSIIKSGVSKSDECRACISGLQIASDLSFEYPWEVPSLALKLCRAFTISDFCESSYSITTSGGVVAQVLQFADLASLDGIMICAKKVPNGPYCLVPAISQYNLSDHFNTTLPFSRVAPKPRGGETIKVLHLSDFHLDPRYAPGSEAACGAYLCCRNGQNTTSAAPVAILSPAPRYGAFQCDTPYDLAIATMESIAPLSGTTEVPFDFAIFTGDLVSHDRDTAMGRDYIEYEESLIYGIFRHYLGSSTPVFAALGNHDSWPQALDALNSLTPKYLADAFSWNYNHLAALWKHEGWINEVDAEVVRTHYGAFSKLHKKGLRIISFNSDFIYTANLFNYINMTDPDPSGTFKFVADELQRAENNGERVWVVAHVLSGWDGSASLPNPTDLWYQIIDRYSPHVIAALFVGHVHEEFIYLNYANNGTVQSSDTANVVTWVGPSVSPLQNLNPGFRVYDVDTVSFDIMESYTWYTNTTDFAALDSQSEVGPTFRFEYSAREVYGKNITGSNGESWAASDPLNATWWHKVSEQMEIEPILVDTLQQYQGRLSTQTTNCTSEACVAAKICYMRSGSHALGSKCPKGFNSVQ